MEAPENVPYNFTQESKSRAVTNLRITEISGTEDLKNAKVVIHIIYPFICFVHDFFFFLKVMIEMVNRVCQLGWAMLPRYVVKHFVYFCKGVFG